MQSFFEGLSAVSLILTMVAVGYIISKVGWFRAEHKTFLVKYLLNIAVPATCFKSVLGSLSYEMITKGGKLLIVPCLSILITLSIGVILAKLLKIEKRRAGVFAIMCGLSNSMFVGLPMCYELFGDAGVSYVLFYYIFNTGIFWTLGIFLLNKNKPEAKLSLASSLKNLATPPLISLLITVALLLLRFEPPKFMMSLATYLGNTVTPLALIYVGYVMYETIEINKIKIRFDKAMVAMLLVRFIVSPLVMYALSTAFELPSLCVSVFLIQAAMPVMIQAILACASRGGDEAFCASGMCITTVACLIEIPIIMMLVQ